MLQFNSADPFDPSVAANKARWYCRLNSEGICERQSQDPNWAGAVADQNPQFLWELGGSNPNDRLLIRESFLPPLQSAALAQKDLAAQLTTALRNKGIDTADLMYLQYSQSIPGREHMAIIVGWGPYLPKWDIYTLGTSGWFEYSYQNAINRASASELPIVPYVLDHGPQGEIVSSYAIARPYYFLFWNPPVPEDPVYRLERLAPSFVKVPNTISFLPPPKANLAGQVFIESPFTQSQMIGAP